MPAFLRSEGPFAVYDHSLRYGQKDYGEPTQVDLCLQKGLERHEDSIASLQQRR